MVGGYEEGTEASDFEERALSWLANVAGGWTRLPKSWVRHMLGKRTTTSSSKTEM